MEITELSPGCLGNNSVKVCDCQAVEKANYLIHTIKRATV